jgi:hypothetical protein
MFSFNFRYEFLRVKQVEKKLAKPHSVEQFLQLPDHNEVAFWDVDINGTVDSCGICQMALGTLCFENAASAR